MASSSPTPLPYPLRASAQGYEFTTDQGAPYLVYFTEAEGYFEPAAFAPYAFMFGFAPVGVAPITPYDTRIAITVLQVAELFLQQDPRHVLVYYCNAQDARQAARFRLFYRWLTHSPQHGYMFRPLLAPPHTYAAAVFDAQNPFAADIEQALPELQQKITPA